MQKFTEKEEELLRYYSEMIDGRNGNLLIIAENTRDDKVFWTDVLRQYLPKAKPFFKLLNAKSKEAADGDPDVKLPNAKSKKTADGNKIILSNYSNVNPDLFVNRKIMFCLDSDYNELIGHQFFCNNQALLQTYFYAIESHNALPQILTYHAQRASLDFNFNSFLAEYSKIIFGLFCCIIYFEKRFLESKIAKPEEFDNKNIAKIIGLNPENDSKIDLSEHGKNILISLKERVENFVKGYNAVHFGLISDLITEKVKPTETFLYINGHILEEKVILPLFKQLKNSNVEIYVKEMNDANFKKETINDKKNEWKNYYEKQIEALSTLYREYWSNSNIENKAMSKIKEDIESKKLIF